jgi:hypothetical protein
MTPPYFTCLVQIFNWLSSSNPSAEVTVSIFLYIRNYKQQKTKFVPVFIKNEKEH